MRSNLTPNQVDEILEKLKDFLENTKKRWDEENPGAGSWLHLSKTYLVKSTVFLIGITDTLVQFVEKCIPTGPEKKAAVLIVIAKVFDYISAAAFPIWLKPFAPVIKEIIVSVIIGNLVDFMVKKYRNGLWKMEGTTNGTPAKEENKIASFYSGEPCQCTRG